MFSSWQYLGSFGVAMLLSGVFTPMMRIIAWRLQVVDTPDSWRKTQRSAIPYLGGLAIALAVAILSLSAAAIHGNPTQDLPLLIGVLLPALALATVGLLDDVRGLTPLPRFVVQSGAGAVTAVALAVTGTGAQISNFPLLNVSLTILWVIGVTNALNLLDNTDGVASGTAAIVAAVLASIALLNGQSLVASLALVLSGACSGFLLWNRFPASIYMGDSGSLFIGFMLAAVAIRIDLTSLPRAQALAAPLLVLVVPIFDTTLVVLSRIRRGLSPFVGGLDHTAHRLRRLGFNVPQTALALWGITLSAGLVALVVSRAQPQAAAAAIGLCGVAFVGGLWLALRLPDTGDLP